MFQRILVPLDGSARAERAVPLAARLARHSGGSVLLLRVLTHPLDAVASFLHPPEETEQVVEAAHTQAVSYLEQVVRSDALSGLGTALQVADSLPAQTILSAAHLQHVDSIVMCRHGGTDFTRWALGSVAQTVARHSPVPVLLLSERAEAGVSDLLQPAGTHPVQVLVPLDGSAFAEAALPPAAHLSAALSAPAPGSLRLVLVLPALDAEQEHPSPRIEASKHKAEMYLHGIEQRLCSGESAPLQLQTSSSVITGTDVAETLIRLAEHDHTGEKDAQESKYAVMAMATHGRHGTDLWVMGSVTERILEASHLPLLVVRTRQRNQTGE
jgi:nucleotide-binding universal stress UspA family protein